MERTRLASTLPHPVNSPPTLSDFAAFLLEHRLDALVAAQIARLEPYDLPLMRFFAHLSPSELHAVSRESIGAWLSAAKEGRAVSHREAELQKWRDNKLEYDISRESVTLTDIVQANAVQRTTLLSFLGEFAKTVSDYASIALEIEEESGMAEKAALDLIEEMAVEKTARLAETSQELEEHRSRIDRLIAHAPDAVVVIDEDKIIRLWNPKADSIFGWSESEALGRTLADTISPASLRKGQNDDKAHFITAEQESVPHQMLSLTAVHKSGREFPISLSTSGFIQAGKQHFVAFIRDITEQQRTQAALEKHRRELEARAEELEQYAWLVSHDLKEPLRKVSVFADLLQHRYAAALPAEAADYVHRMEASTTRMSAVIDAVLAYANVSRAIEKKEPLAVAKLVNSALTNLELLVADTGAEVQLSLESIPAVYGAEVQLTQVFENVLANAIKYRRPNATPRIVVEGREASGHVITTVRDNGVGFHSDYAEKIFAPFQRLESHNGATGTGIGLALCRKIVDTHGGGIWAESSEGAGSTFFVKLPLAR